MPRAPRDTRVNHGALSRSRSNEQVTSGEGDALPHAEQAKATLMQARVESPSTVLHPKAHRPRRIVQRHRGLECAAVLEHVGERLLGDAEQTKRGGLRQVDAAIAGHDGDSQSFGGQIPAQRLNGGDECNLRDRSCTLAEIPVVSTHRLRRRAPTVMSRDSTLTCSIPIARRARR